MNQSISDLVNRIRLLEEELEQEYTKKRGEFKFIAEQEKIRFTQEVAEIHKKFKTGLVHYVSRSHPFNILTAPIIYCGLIPFALLDIFATIYQTTCFPIYGIPKVRRKDYLIFDIQDLSYLNVIEKINCFYCSYANGLVSYVREIAARTEQYWCPIKHARRVIAAHSRYNLFFEFGDAESFRRGLERIRKEFEDAEKKS